MFARVSSEPEVLSCPSTKRDRFCESRSSHARCSKLTEWRRQRRRKRKARPRRPRDGGEGREESTTSVAAGCTCITCGRVRPCLRASAAGSRDLGECWSLIRPREKAVCSASPTSESGAEHRGRVWARRGATRRDALQREILEFAKLAALFASLEYAAGAAGAAVRGKELLGYAARIVRFSVERADRRIRSSNSGVDRHCKISVIYTGYTPAVSLVETKLLVQYKIDFSLDFSFFFL